MRTTTNTVIWVTSSFNYCKKSNVLSYLKRTFFNLTHQVKFKTINLLQSSVFHVRWKWSESKMYIEKFVWRVISRAFRGYVIISLLKWTRMLPVLSSLLSSFHNIISTRKGSNNFYNLAIKKIIIWNCIAINFIEAPFFVEELLYLILHVIVVKL